MGRVEKRKQERLNKNKKQKNNNIEEPNGKETLYTTIKIIVVMVLLLFILYYVVAVFVTKEIDISGNKEDETTENSATNTVSNKILAKNIFNQTEETYYVYFYDFNDENRNIASAISKLTDDKVYRVDTSSSLNKNYVTDEDTGNKDASVLENLKVINPTLIKVANDKIVEYYENEDSIVAYLNK